MLTSTHRQIETSNFAHPPSFYSQPQTRRASIRLRPKNHETSRPRCHVEALRPRCYIQPQTRHASIRLTPNNHDTSRQRRRIEGLRAARACRVDRVSSSAVRTPGRTAPVEGHLCHDRSITGAFAKTLPPARKGADGMASRRQPPAERAAQSFQRRRIRPLWHRCSIPLLCARWK